MTNPGNRANDRAVRAHQASHPGISLSDARRAVAAQHATDSEATALLAGLRDLNLLAGARPPLWSLGGVGSGDEGEVAVDLNAPLLGRTVRDIRDLLRRGLSWGLRVDDARRALDLPTSAAQEMLQHLVTAGWLTAPDEADGVAGDDQWDRQDYRTWELTADGTVLARASGRTPTTRARADALVAKVVKAAAGVNADPHALWWVKEIRAAGAYDDPDAAKMQHVDLAVDLRPRLDDPAEQAKAERRRQDDAEDRNLPRARDMVGYGHWETRLALAGRSKVLRLFRLEPDLPGRLVFHEPRDLTVAAVPTGAYRRPADTATDSRCSWCRRTVTANRIARTGTAVSTSPIALCPLCLVLGHADNETGFDRALRITVNDALGTLSDAPFHDHGCGLCGHDVAQDGPWWPEPRRRTSDRPLRIWLCTVCVGLMGLADRPDRPGWWRARYENACLTGMYARLDPEAQLGAAKPVRRKAARLTETHQEILRRIEHHGALSPVDLARLDFDEEDVWHRHSSDWWHTRVGHLYDHRLVTPVGATDDIDPDDDRVRLTDPAEREIAEQMIALFIPGPVWDGADVVDPEPPAEWAVLNRQYTALSQRLDTAALERRAAVPIPFDQRRPQLPGPLPTLE